MVSLRPVNVSQLTVFRYNVFAYAGTSLGVLVCGWTVRVVQREAHWTRLESYRLVFWAYAALGALKLLLCFLLTNKCEPHAQQLERISGQPEADAVDETQPLIGNEEHTTQHTVQTNGSVQVPLQDPDKNQEKSSYLTRLLPKLSRESANIVWQLCCLFAIDSIASGLVSSSWMTWFFEQKFRLSEGALGTLFFVTAILSAISMFAAAPLARRIGLIKTMVFTHVPASIALALIPLPSNVYVAMGLLAFRGSTNAMDQPPRQAFIAAAVHPNERTAVMGVVNVVKTLSQSAGPAITGWLAERSKIWLSFIVAGSLKVLYDVLILLMFLGHRTVEERAEHRLVTEDTTASNEDAPNADENNQRRD
jgi:Na+/melibiose symporter-like transporter